MDQQVIQSKIMPPNSRNNWWSVPEIGTFQSYGKKRRVLGSCFSSPITHGFQNQFDSRMIASYWREKNYLSRLWRKESSIRNGNWTSDLCGSHRIKSINKRENCYNKLHWIISNPLMGSSVAKRCPPVRGMCLLNFF